MSIRKKSAVEAGLLRSMKQAVRIAAGREAPASAYSVVTARDATVRPVPNFSREEITTIRQRLNLSQQLPDRFEFEWCRLLSQCERLSGMPVVLRYGPFAFYFYSAEGTEPAHVHVRRDDARAKVWLEPVTLSWQSGFTAHETRRIIQIVRQEQQSLLRRWNEHFRR